MKVDSRYPVVDKVTDSVCRNSEVEYSRLCRSLYVVDAEVVSLFESVEEICLSVLFALLLPTFEQELTTCKTRWFYIGAPCEDK